MNARTTYSTLMVEQDGRDEARKGFAAFLGKGPAAWVSA